MCDFGHAASPSWRLPVRLEEVDLAGLCGHRHMATCAFSFLSDLTDSAHSTVWSLLHGSAAPRARCCPTRSGNTSALRARQRAAPREAGRAPSSAASSASVVGKAASSACRRSSSACVCSRPSGTARARARQPCRWRGPPVQANLHPALAQAALRAHEPRRQPAGELLSAQPRMRPPSGAARRAPSAATPARSRPRAWQSAQQRVQGSDLLAVTAAASPARRLRNALCACTEVTGSLSAGAQQRCSEGLEVEP